MLTVLAYFIIAIGFLLFILPIPVGIFFIVGGTAMLNVVDPKALKRIATLRRKHPKIDGILHTATKKSPRFLKVILHKTRLRSAQASEGTTSTGD